MLTHTTALVLALCPALVQTDTKTAPAAPSHKYMKDPCFVHKASDLIGGDVKNPQGEDLGEIQDLVINPESGNVEYAVLSFGGFLGMGDKLFALPWRVLEPVHDKDGDQGHFLLSVDKERLKTSPGFPKDNWPDLSSPDWAKSVHEFYEDEMKADAKGAMEGSESAGKAVEASGRYHLVKASDLKGTDVKTSDGKDAGEIADLAVDPNKGRIAFFVLSSGGFLGFGKNDYVLPWQACTTAFDEDKDLVCRLTVPQAKFERAPVYVGDDWKRMSSPVFVKEVYTYYETPVYWKDSDVMEASSKKQ